MTIHLTQITAQMTQTLGDNFLDGDAHFLLLLPCGIPKKKTLQIPGFEYIPLVRVSSLHPSRQSRKEEKRKEGGRYQRKRRDDGQRITHVNIHVYVSVS